MDDPYNLMRFIEAQTSMFTTALQELSAGCKRSHWMWFIFPQLAGLGQSPTALLYGISAIGEARAYSHHPLLGPRLRQCVRTLLPWAAARRAEQIFGQIDALKLRSCLTLFECVEPDDLFERALQDFFDGKPDQRTLALLNANA